MPFLKKSLNKIYCIQSNKNKIKKIVMCFLKIDFKFGPAFLSEALLLFARISV